MITKIILEAVIYTLLYSALMFVLFKVQGARFQLYNYPPAIRERAIEKGIITQEEMDANAKKNKSVGIVFMALLCVIITCVVNGQRNFVDGFLQSYIFLNAFSLFDALVIDTIWFCHSSWWVIPGTEDMTEAYHDYVFHWKWFFLGLVSILPLAAIIGALVALVGVIF